MAVRHGGPQEEMAGILGGRLHQGLGQRRRQRPEGGGGEQDERMPPPAVIGQELLRRGLCLGVRPSGSGGAGGRKAEGFQEGVGPVEGVAGRFEQASVALVQAGKPRGHLRFCGPPEGQLGPGAGRELDQVQGGLPLGGEVQDGLGPEGFKLPGQLAQVGGLLPEALLGDPREGGPRQGAGGEQGAAAFRREHPQLRGREQAAQALQEGGRQELVRDRT
ncbi:MAG: hypothetical protein BWY56_02491 [Acidobacteria bacterium ADurb.Bin340]|nr:MAG: hypothetical protein BWY56_02491 [Acidobacteria bacterium ADurb.Bin340]